MSEMFNCIQIPEDGVEVKIADSSNYHKTGIRPSLAITMHLETASRLSKVYLNSGDAERMAREMIKLIPELKERELENILKEGK